MNDSQPHSVAPYVPRGQSVGPLSLPEAPRRPQVLSASPDALGLLKALRRRWKMALSLGLILAAISAVTVWRLVPREKYTAIATIHVSTSPRYIIFDPHEKLADYPTYQRTQVALAKSRLVIVDALRKPEIAELATIKEKIDADNWLADQLKIGFSGSSEILEISLSGNRPADVAKLVNAVLDSYLSVIVEKERTEREARLSKLRRLWERYQDKLEDKRKAIRELSEVVGSDDKQTLALQQKYKFEHLAIAEQEQMKVQSDLRRSRAELAVLEAQPQAAGGIAPSPAAVDERVESHPTVVELRNQVQSLTTKYQMATRLARDNSDPSVRSIRRPLDEASRNLAALRAKLRPAIAAAIAAKNREAAKTAERSDLSKLRTQISVMEMYKDTLEQDITRIRQESKTISRGGVDLHQHQDEIQIVSETSRKIGSTVEALEVEMGAPDRIQELDRAAVPRLKDELREAKIGGGVGLAMFAFVLLGVSFWEFRARRIDSVDEVVHGLGLRLIGAVPALTGREGRRGNIAEVQRLQSHLTESIDATRTMLLHASREAGVRVVMITSAEQGEGKTSLSCHLASSLARAGRRTLLVDCDLRSPVTHRLFDLPSGPGLCEVLREEATLDEVIQATPAAGLHLIPGGRCDAVAIQALTQDRFRTFFDELKTRYDFIIVDSAPVLAVADSLLVGQVVDAVLFSILRDVSRIPKVHAAYERLAVLDTRMLGAVVAGTTSGFDGSKYPYASRNAT